MRKLIISDMVHGQIYSILKSERNRYNQLSRNIVQNDDPFNVASLKAEAIQYLMDRFQEAEVI